MSGHNKWSQIKHKKAKEDSKRSKAFTKIIKEITIAAKEGGGDPEHNARLRMLIEKAKEINMPAENTAKAIKRGTGELPGVHYEEFTYEGYGPYGIAVMVDTLSDNKNRTIAELRRVFSSNGGNIAEGGAVSWMFDHAGVVRTGSTKATEDDILETLLDFNIIDIKQEGDTFCVICDIKALDLIKKKLLEKNITVESAELEWVAKTPTNLSEEQEEKAVNFLSELQDHDDVQNVFTNLG